VSDQPPPLASSRAQSLYGCVTGSALIGVFLGAGLISMLLPLPRAYEGLRDPLAVGLGIGGVVFTALLAMLPLTLFRAGERKRMDHLFGILEMSGRDDIGHGAEYRGELAGRSTSASVSLDGASPVTRHTRASFGLDANTGTQMVVCRRGSPYLAILGPAATRHVLLLDQIDRDVRATHPGLARAFAATPLAWSAVDRLLQGVGEAEAALSVGPSSVMLRVDGEGATQFDADKVRAIYADLRVVAESVESLGPLDTPVAPGKGWLDRSHHDRRGMRWQQWAISCGCVSVLVGGWVLWVVSVLLPIG